MTDTVITVQNISKKYILSHQSKAAYATLRDVLAGSARSLVQSMLRRRNSADNALIEEFWALKNVSFEVKRGQRLGIIGRNGAGKSTLLKILSRIAEPTSGRITLKGRVASLLEVGTGFHPELTGRENIYLNGAILGMTRAEIRKRFDAIVDFSETSAFLDTPVKRYSSGMYVRLAFAVAAHLEPEILIVDEVLAVGDAEFQRKCLGKMGEVAGEGRTVLFVSHNMQAIRRLCNQAIILEKGAAHFHDNIESAINHYSSELSISTNDVDVSERSRPMGHGTIVRLMRIGLAGNTELNFGEQIDLDFTLRCTQRVRDIVIGIAFDTPDGSRVMTLDSDFGHKPIDLPAGESTVRITLDHNPLHPGSYIVGTAIFSRGHTLDGMAGAATWICNPGTNDNVALRGYGACRLPVKVAVSEKIEMPVKQTV